MDQERLSVLDGRINVYLTFNGPVITLYAEITDKDFHHIGSSSCSERAFNLQEDPFNYLKVMMAQAKTNLVQGITGVPILDTPTLRNHGGGSEGS